MPKLEERIERLRQLRTAAPNDAAVSLARKSLRDRASLVVAEAAKFAAEHRVSDLIPDLLAAFERLLENPVKTDPKCRGKLAIVQALTRLDYGESAPFLRGARHVQMEPVWGGQEDAAFQLRAASVLALVQCSDLSRPEVLRELVDALADPGDPVRIEAVRAIAQMNGDEAALLLRLKGRLGDRRPIVTGHVFDALLALETVRAVPFVAGYLKFADAEIRDEAAFALGGSRLPDAIKSLIETCSQTRDQEFRSVILRALSASRQAPAIDFLLSLIRTGLSQDALLAADALKVHDSPEIQALVEEARKERAK